MGWESSDVVRFGLGPLLQCQKRIRKLKSAYKSLIIGQCDTNFIGWEIIGWESCEVARFDLGPLLQDQKRVAKLNLLIIALRGL